ncbi:hypothetical protein [Rhodococcoides kyotonense]|uniref:Uncharacterized protein n=1 Tax=Rhodococcoides kyotonense TaxID=398843 RepID=A0A239MGQ3_9NOCA|nr:hypothetical protein [Rhodococcus kyotonensis]SNT41851.1 hypothetical protein SAMN05421642_11829 [Rhodococcus kyotonensis]
MESPKKIETLFSHTDSTPDDAPAHKTDPVVYTSLFSGDGTSRQIP